MGTGNDKHYAALCVSISVVLTSLLIGFTTRLTDPDDAWKFIALIIFDLIVTYTAVTLILSILTKKKETIEVKHDE